MLSLYIVQKCTVRLQLRGSQILCRHCMTLSTHVGFETMKLIWMTTLAACRHPPAPQKFHSTPRQRSTQGQYRTEQPPADIADSILTNPWTAALMQGDCDRPQLYSNSLALTRIGIGSWAAGPAHAHAHAASQPSLQAQPQSQQAPENSVTADPSSSDTAAASLHSSQEEDEHRLESGPDKQGTDSCSSVGEDGAGSVGGDSRSHDDCNHRHMPSTQDKPQAWRQDQSRRAGPMQRSASSAASDSQQADARSDSSSDKASSGKARSGNGRSDWGCSNKASSDRRSSAAASGGNAQPTRHTDWAADFTSKHGEQAQGLQQHAAAAKSEEVKVAGGRQRGFTSWIGDFGHLEGPRFNKQQGRAWQAHMHSQREQPPDSSSSPNFIAEVGKHCFEVNFLCSNHRIHFCHQKARFLGSVFVLHSIAIVYCVPQCVACTS